MDAWSRYAANGSFIQHFDFLQYRIKAKNTKPLFFQAPLVANE
jgi:hypothetical protein